MNVGDQKSLAMSYFSIFVIQFFSFLAAYLLLWRKSRLPSLSVLVTFAIYQTSPIYVAVAGAVSAVYLVDFLFPVLVFRLLNDRQMRESSSDPIWIFAFGLLIFLPALAGALNVLVGEVEFDSRSIIGTIQWFFRNANFLLVMLYGLSLRLDAHHVTDFVRLNVLLLTVLCVFGVLNYWYGVDLAVFDRMLVVNDPDGELFLSEKRVGYGFLGLFRGAVGQWGAICVLLMVGLIKGKQFGRFPQKIFISISMAIFVLQSFSRAGVLAISGGLLVLFFSGRRMSQKIFASIGFISGVLYISLSDEVYASRILGITAVEDDSSLARVTGWRLGVDYLMDDYFSLFFGIGPADESGVSLITGNWGAHNEFLDVIFRMGIFGLLLLCLLLLAIGTRFFALTKSQDDSTRALGATMLSILAANIICSITQSHLINSYATYMLGVFIYWLYGITLGMSGGEKKRGLN